MAARAEGFALFGRNLPDRQCDRVGSQLHRFNQKLADADDFEFAHERVRPRCEGVAMPNDARWGLLEYQALFDLFEKDCGRPATTMTEVRYWAGAQNRSIWNLG